MGTKKQKGPDFKPFFNKESKKWFVLNTPKTAKFFQS